jgi:hypothetical protein
MRDVTQMANAFASPAAYLNTPYRSNTAAGSSSTTTNALNGTYAPLSLSSTTLLSPAHPSSSTLSSSHHINAFTSSNDPSSSSTTLELPRSPAFFDSSAASSSTSHALAVASSMVSTPVPLSAGSNVPVTPQSQHDDMQHITNNGNNSNNNNNSNSDHDIGMAMSTMANSTPTTTMGMPMNNTLNTDQQLHQHHQHQHQHQQALQSLQAPPHDATSALAAASAAVSRIGTLTFLIISFTLSFSVMLIVDLLPILK